jgi:hypothetical protein
MAVENEDRRSRLRDFFGKVRPQIAVSILILGGVAVLGVMKNMNEVSTMCVAGIIALAKDVLQSDA